MKKNLVLLGMMGTGKSTIGKILAKKLGFKHIDTDKLIEKKNKMKINKMFEMKGENFFRNEEEKIVIENLVKNSTSTIFSLGGGAFLNETIRSHVISDSISFWLDDKVTTIFNRLNKSYRRPLFKKNKFKILEKLYHDRKTIYKMANYKINCDKLTLQEICKKIVNLYEEK